MAHITKRRSKRAAPEALDWRALASGPALRGLSDVLSTPAAVAHERAARRLALENEENPLPPQKSQTPTEALSPTVGVLITDEISRVEVEFPSLPVHDPAGEPRIPSAIIPAAAATTQTPTVAVSPTVGVSNDLEFHPPPAEYKKQVPSTQTPTVAVSPTVGDLPTVGVLTLNTPDHPAVVTSTDSDASALADNNPLTPTVAVSPTVGQLPTVGVSPTVGVHNTKKPAHSTVDTSIPSVNNALPENPPPTPTVGVNKKQNTGTSWVDKDGVPHEAARVQRVNIAQQSMTLGEERFYQALWHARESDGVVREAAHSKIFSMGYDRLSRLVRLDEKSIRQLIPRLIAKKILELLAGENSSTRIGKTYRIFSYEEILERQRAAAMYFVAKRGRAVEFVWNEEQKPPQTPTVGESPSVGISPTGTVGESPTGTVGVTPTPLDTLLDTSLSQSSSSSVARALSEYAAADDDAVRAIIANSRRMAPDATFDEIVHFIHEKGRVVRSGKIANPLAFLIVYVPKCFQPEMLRMHREKARAELAQRRAAERRAEAEMGRLRDEWLSWLSDPAVSDEDKAWAAKMLAEGA